MYGRIASAVADEMFGRYDVEGDADIDATGIDDLDMDVGVDLGSAWMLPAGAAIGLGAGTLLGAGITAAARGNPERRARRARRKEMVSQARGERRAQRITERPMGGGHRAVADAIDEEDDDLDLIDGDDDETFGLLDKISDRVVSRMFR